MIDEILRTLDDVPALFARLEREITAERAHRYLAALESVPAPSQTARWGRVPVVERLLREDGVLDGPRVGWEPDFAAGGNAALTLGVEGRAKRVWLLAHLDQISYALDPGDHPTYPLVPLCFHMQRGGRHPALAVGHDLATGTVVVHARGEIVVDGPSIAFHAADDRPLGPGTRVVYDPQLAWDPGTGALAGQLDDTVACAAMLLAAGVLRHYPVEVLIGLTDEEEGAPGDANQSFCRGGRRLVRFFDPPALAIVSDVHESEAMIRGPGPRDLRPGDGAVFAERSSSGRGTVTPPLLYAFQQAMAESLGERGVLLRENWGGYVSRSEDINATILTPNIALVGFLCSNRHYAADRPRAHMDDLLHLARVFVCYTLLAHSDLWGRVTRREP
ncbi:MAG: hypothetical protein AVDCRST_MAG19-4159 [uncultured Thermomicrobiales bacterium]|uniref:M20/M25/M40 family metallo-hydrolase n=1 Tax=uncultured Thermomicrobiales bacterium TaxID=1645740 RepID=A0A6J4VMB7_9BACT|nr:MAG: hypothetical protein AVDCRST_MAG19-4159 [uncultured Thermomicrobiales bacterium]